MKPIIFKGAEYYPPIEVSGSVISMSTYKGAEKPNFHTSLPISDAEYRSENPTKSKVKIKKWNLHTVFLITDDWGHKYTLAVPCEYDEETKMFFSEFTKLKLL